MNSSISVAKESLTLNVYPGGAGLPSTAGRAELAFNSVAAARDAIRCLKAEPGGLNVPVTVVIHAGVHELVEPLVFGPQDSGTAKYPIRYVAATGAAPVLSGGRCLDTWQEIQHNGLRCWVTDLPDVAAGKWNFTRLFVNRQDRPRPRLPKTGFYHFTGLAGFDDTGMKWHQGPDRANFAPGEIQAWKNIQDVEVITYQLWFDTHHRITAIDEANQVVQFREKSLGSLRDERHEFARYYVENVFEALDTPGQWYLDRPSGRLYYLPLPEESLADTRIVAPRIGQLIVLQGEKGRRVKHLRFENLSFAHQQWDLPPGWPGFMQAAYGVPGAIILNGAEACVFYGCTVSHVNGYGIEVLAGSTKNTIAACVFNDTGAGGVKIGQEQTRPADAGVPMVVPPVVPPAGGEVPPMATTVVDCTVRDFGRIYPSAIGIWIGNSGWNRIIRNEIFDGNYTGISCGWTWGYAPTRTVCNRIEYNHIHHINHREILSDNGGIYLLGIQPGTVLRGNVIHDISCYGYGGWGIYPDEGSSEILVEDNLVYHTKKESFFVHYGRDLMVRNNIFALSEADHMSLGKREMHHSTTMSRNIFLPCNGRVGGTEYLKSWSTLHYTLRDNLYWTADGSPLTFNGMTLSKQQEQGQNLGAVVADPFFVDAAGGNFTLRPDSPVSAIGFKPFDVTAAGPRKGAQRPLTYADYLKGKPLTSTDVPIVRTCIELATPANEVPRAERVDYTVTISNEGRAEARGVVRVCAGPAEAVKVPVTRAIAFTLAPGEKLSERLTAEFRLEAPHFWLESSGEGDAVIGTHKVSLRDACWKAPRVPEVEDPAAIAGVVAAHQGHRIIKGERLIAELKVAVTERYLLFYGELYETSLRPNLVEPWAGTGFELFVPRPLPPDAPSGTQPQKDQVFIVPGSEANSAVGLRLNEGGQGVTVAPEIRTWSKPGAAGCIVGACIPWACLGAETKPDTLPFEMIVDVVNPLTGAIGQMDVFDMPWDGWKRLTGRLACG